MLSVPLQNFQNYKPHLDMLLCRFIEQLDNLLDLSRAQEKKNYSVSHHLDMTLPGLMMLDTSMTDWDTLQRLWQDPIIRSHSKHLKFWIKTVSSSVHYYYHFEKQLQAYCWGQTANECLIIDHQIIIRPQWFIMKQVSSDLQTIKLGSTTILHCQMVVVCTRLSSTE